jgi:hypothetical protein
MCFGSGGAGSQNPGPGHGPLAGSPGACQAGATLGGDGERGIALSRAPRGQQQSAL